MQRRNFIFAAGSALTCLLVPPAFADDGLPAASMLPGQDGFTTLLGQTLMAYVDTRGVALTLDAVRAGTPQPGVDQFCLLLSGSAEGPLDDGIADVYHASFGSAPLFIECYGHAGGMTQYRIQLSLPR